MPDSKIVLYNFVRLKRLFTDRESWTLSSEWLWRFAVLIKAKLNFGDQKRKVWTNTSVSNTDGREFYCAMHTDCLNTHWEEIQFTKNIYYLIYQKQNTGLVLKWIIAKTLRVQKKVYFMIWQKYDFQYHWPEIMAHYWEVLTISASNISKGV